jgi:hypothetical protein
MFPLFDALYKETELISPQILNYEERLQLMEQIKSLDKDGHEYLYALIRKYQLEIENGDFNDLPYQPKVNKSGYKFEMKKMPDRLLIILKHFVNLHLKKLLEERARNNFFHDINKNEKKSLEPSL